MQMESIRAGASGLGIRLIRAEWMYALYYVCMYVCMCVNPFMELIN